jgi:hypothetical protein
VASRRRLRQRSGSPSRLSRREKAGRCSRDTWTGRHAEALYRALGYVTVGVIPRYARGSLTPELEPTTIMYKHLA